MKAPIANGHSRTKADLDRYAKNMKKLRNIAKGINKDTRAYIRF